MAKKQAYLDRTTKDILTLIVERDIREPLKILNFGSYEQYQLAKEYLIEQIKYLDWE